MALTAHFGDGVTRTFAIPFSPALGATATVNAVSAPISSQTPTSVTFTAAPAVGATILVNHAAQNETGSSAPVVAQSDDLTIIGPAALSAINTDLLTGVVNGWYDCDAFQSGSIQVIASAGISAGGVFFEQTNDPALAPAGVPLRAYEASLVNANPNVAAFNVAANTARIFTVPVNARYIRVRISTAFAGGTVRAVSVLSQRSASYPTINAQQQTAANFQATVTPASGFSTLIQPGVPATPFTLNSAAGTNGALILTGSSGVTAAYATNTGAAAAFMKLYNKATAPTVGTDVPVMIIPIPAAVGGVPGVANPNFGILGLRFPLGLGIAITGGAADTDTTTITAGQVKVALSRVA